MFGSTLSAYLKLLFLFGMVFEGSGYVFPGADGGDADGAYGTDGGDADGGDADGAEDDPDEMELMNIIEEFNNNTCPDTVPPDFLKKVLTREKAETLVEEQKCKGTLIIPKGYLLIAPGAFDGLITSKGIGISKVEIPPSVKVIGPKAFLGCFIFNVEFAPDSKLISIMEQAFAYTHLREFKVPLSCKCMFEQALYNIRRESLRSQFVVTCDETFPKQDITSAIGSWDFEVKHYGKVQIAINLFNGDSFIFEFLTEQILRLTHEEFLANLEVQRPKWFEWENPPSFIKTGFTSKVDYLSCVHNGCPTNMLGLPFRLYTESATDTFEVNSESWSTFKEIISKKEKEKEKEKVKEQVEVVLTLSWK